LDKRAEPNMSPAIEPHPARLDPHYLANSQRASDARRALMDRPRVDSALELILNNGHHQAQEAKEKVTNFRQFAHTRGRKARRRRGGSLLVKARNGRVERVVGSGRVRFF
jgi:hypothetical protein